VKTGIAQNRISKAQSRDNFRFTAIRFQGDCRKSELEMRISDVLCKEAIITDLKAGDKKGVLEELAEPVSHIAGIGGKELVKVLMEREQLGSTGIGGGIAIPHGKLKGLEKLVLGFGLSRQGIDFDSMDNRPSHIFFLLVTPENSTGLHLKLLARLSRILKNDDFKQKLMRISDPDELLNEIEPIDTDF
jgi:nitrogen PTS system EIIA component